MNQVRLVQLRVVDGVLVLGTEINQLLPALGRLSRGYDAPQDDLDE
jgi:hypothetical protein